MATQTFLADVGSIEQQLRQLWKGEARDLEAGESVARYPAIFQRLAASAGRVIIDSANLQNPLTDFPQVEQIIKLCPDSAISDLAWSRITQWRQLTAQFFDGPVQASYFPQLRSIVVEQTTASGGGDRIGAEAM